MRLYRISFVVGLAAGFVAGTRAGRERYDQMVKIAQQTKDNPQFQQAVGMLQAQASTLAATASQKVADGAPKIAQNAMHAAQDRIPMLKHRNGNGSGPRASHNGKGAGSHPFAATSSHLRPTE